MLKSKNLTQKRSGVSDIIANILILSITVVLFTTIFYWITALPPPEGKTTIDISGEFSGPLGPSAPYRYYLNLTHKGGPTLYNYSTKIYAVTGNESLPVGNPNPVNFLENDWSAGEVFRYSWTYSFYFESIEITVVDTSKNQVIWRNIIPGKKVNVPPIIRDAGVTPNPVVVDKPFTVWVDIFDENGDNPPMGLNRNSVFANLGSLGLGTVQLTFNSSSNRFERNFAALNDYSKVSTTPYTIFINGTDYKNLTATTTISFLVVENTEAVDIAISSTDIMFSNKNPVTGENITITIVVRNLAGGTGRVNISVYDSAQTGTTPIKENISITVPPYGNSILNVPWTPRVPAKHTIVVNTPSVRPSELNWSNNNATKDIGVYIFYDDAEKGMNKWTTYEYGFYHRGTAPTQRYSQREAGWSGDIASYALSFNSVNQYVHVRDSSSLDVTSGITIEAWVYLIELTGRSDINIIVNKDAIAYEIAVGDNSNPSFSCNYGNWNVRQYEFTFYLSGIRYSGGYPTNRCGWIPGGALIPKLQWTHVALTYDGTTVRAYVNGVQTAQYAASGNIGTTNEALRVAARGGNGAPGALFNGYIDEVRLLNRGLTPSEISEDYNARAPYPVRTGTVLWFHFDENTGTTALDASGLGNNGDIRNNPAWVPGVGGPAGGTWKEASGTDSYSYDGYWYVSSNPGTPPLFSDDFDDGNYNGWQVLSGSWAVENGELSGTSGGGEAWIYYRSFTGTLFSRPFNVEFDIIFNTVGNKRGGMMIATSIAPRTSTSGYVVDWTELDPAGTYQYRIIKYNNGIASSSLTFPQASQLNTGQKYRWKIEFGTRDISLYVNGQFIGRMSDSTYMNDLYLGFYAPGGGGGQHIHYDNVVVALPGTTTTINLNDVKLITRSINLSAVIHGELLFWTKYNIPKDSGGTVWIRTRGSTGGWGSWIYIEPIDQYPGVLNATDPNTDFRGKRAFTGVSGSGTFTYEFVKFNLSKYINFARTAYLQIAFRFHGYNVPSSFNGGWYLDDIAVLIYHNGRPWGIASSQKYTGNFSFGSGNPYTGAPPTLRYPNDLSSVINNPRRVVHGLSRNAHLTNEPTPPEPAPPEVPKEGYIGQNNTIQWACGAGQYPLVCSSWTVWTSYPSSMTVGSTYTFRWNAGTYSGPYSGWRWLYTSWPYFYTYMYYTGPSGSGYRWGGYYQSVWRCGLVGYYTDCAYGSGYQTTFTPTNPGWHYFYIYIYQYCGSGWTYCAYGDGPYTLRQINIYAYPNTIFVTVKNSFGGGNVIVDGVWRSSPYTAWWTSGSWHSIGAISPQTFGTTRYIWSSWSDGGAQTHWVAPTSSVTYTAYFTTQYWITVQNSFGSGNIVVDGRTYSSPYAAWWTSGSWHTIGAISPQTFGTTRYIWSSWSDGGAQTHTVAPTSAVTYTANFNTEYLITVQNSFGGGNVIVDGVTRSSPYTAWWISGSSHTIGAISPQFIGGSARYTFTSWSDGGAQTHTVAPTSSVTYTAFFTVEYLITVQNSFGSGNVVVDGVTQVSPYSVWWVSGSTHTIGAISPQTFGTTRYIWSSWSDGGAQTHTVAPTSSVTYTAYFTTQYLITVKNSFGGGNVIVDGVTRSSPYTAWWTSGSVHTIGAISPQVIGSARYTFTSWSDGGAQTHTVAPTSSVTYTAYFMTEYLITIQNSFGSGNVIVDGVTRASPYSVWWLSGSTHTIGAISPQTFGTTRYVWTSWSDGGAQSHTITITGAVTYTANFNTEYFITVRNSFGTGTVRIDSVSYSSPYTAWWVSGSTHLLEAVSPQTFGTTRYVWTSWSDGGAQSHNVAPTSSITYTAYFNTEYLITVQNSFGAGNVVVDGVSRSSPYTTWWVSGSSHTIGAISPQIIGSARYTWVSWSDGGAQSHNVAPTSSVTYTAYFRTEYLITIQNSFGSGSVVVDGVTRTAPYTTWWLSGSSHTIGAISPQVIGSARYTWVSWSDGGAQTHTVAPTSAVTYTANFNVEYWITVQNSFSGGTVNVDGVVRNSPYSAWWFSGSTHTIGAISPQTVGGGVYTWVSWSDGGAQTHTVAPTSSVTYTANFDAAYLITVQNSFSGGNVVVDGVTRASPYSVWWASGSTHTIGAISPQIIGGNTRYTWTSWSDGGAQSHTVAPTSSVTYTAYFNTEYLITIQNSFGSGNIIVDGLTQTSPYSVWWISGSTHTIGAISPQTFGSTRYIWRSWSDGGAQTHNIVITGSTTYTANFITEYYLTVITNPVGLDSPSGSGWYTSGSIAYASLSTGSITDPGGLLYTFISWSGDASGTNWAQSNPIVMNAPKTAIANFDRSYIMLANLTVLETVLINLNDVKDAQLSFYYISNLNPDTSRGQRDAVFVQVSTDGGKNWKDLHEIYGRQPTWTLVTIDLTSYTGQIIKLRFLMYINANVQWNWQQGGYTWAGVFIDEISIVGNSTGAKIMNDKLPVTNAECGTENAECGMRNAEGETSKMERETQNVEHGTSNVERWNGEHGTQNVEHGTQNVERQTSNMERGTQNVERQTSNVERGTRNVERRTLNV